MKLTIVAATGGVGRHLVDQAISAGHDVTAIARRPERITADVSTVAVDLAQPSASVLQSAVAGADAVLSGLGPRNRADAGIVEVGTRAITNAMQAVGVSRIVVVSARPVLTVASRGRPEVPRHDPGDGVVARYVVAPLLKAMFGDLYRDLARMEDDLADSSLNWTVMRPPRLTNGRLTSAYRTETDGGVRRGYTVSRADVAHLMLDTLHRPETIGQAISLAT